MGSLTSVADYLHHPQLVILNLFQDLFLKFMSNYKMMGLLKDGS
jgi:hypothetical protein